MPSPDAAVEGLSGTVLTAGIAPSAGEAPQYRVHEAIGAGGQAIVFRGERIAPDSGVVAAIKVWKPSFVYSNPATADLVLRKESVALSRLNERVPPTPFVVRFLDSGSFSASVHTNQVEVPWLALEYIDGGALGSTLRDRVLRTFGSTGHGFYPARALRLLSGVALGLRAIHDTGVVHRDLKPTNVLVSGSGDDELAKITDFGIARPTGMEGTFGTSVAVGSPGYAAPEQLKGEAVGPWSDVFSLTALVYFVLTGDTMFGGAAMMRLANVFAGKFRPVGDCEGLHPAFRAPGVLEGLSQAIEGGIRYRAAERTPTVAQLWHQIEPILERAAGGTAPVEIVEPEAPPAPTPREYVFSVIRPATPHVLDAVAFSSDGRAVASGEGGLWSFNGSEWRPYPAISGLPLGRLNVLARLGPERWFYAGERGLLGILEGGVNAVRHQIGGDAYMLTAAAVREEEHFAVAASAGDRPPLLYVMEEGRWAPPLILQGFREVRAITELGASDWVIAGVDAKGKGALATASPGRSSLRGWPLDCAPLNGLARDGTGAVFAVGAGGFAFRLSEGHPALEPVMTRRDLTCVGTDRAGSAWGAASGRIVLRQAGPEGQSWMPLWQDAAWSSRFLAVAAFEGFVVAAAADGSMVTGRAPAEPAEPNPA